MISIQDAIQKIEQYAERLDTESVRLQDALGRVVAEDIISPIDSPPFDKALMDGYAVRSKDISHAGVSLRLIEEITAGQVPTSRLEANTATRVMTGSPLPMGADAVVVVESTQVESPDQVLIHDAVADPEQNILRQGTCMRSGEVVISPATRLTPQQIGLLAEIGCDPVTVFWQPHVSVLSTGDELVEPAAELQPGQIRNSNGPMLTALASEAGAKVSALGIVADDDNRLRQAISEGLKSDVLLLSGGVSAGVKDLVPAILRDLGVEQVFHKVKIKPGKPIWFGVRQGCLVFGLPGNPVSSFACFHVFVRTAIHRMSRHAVAELPNTSEKTSPFGKLRVGRAPNRRTTYFPARRIVEPDGQVVIDLLPWKGSADLRTVASADCLAVLPADEAIPDGKLVEYLPLGNEPGG